MTEYARTLAPWLFWAFMVVVCVVNWHQARENRKQARRNALDAIDNLTNARLNSRHALTNAEAATQNAKNAAVNAAMAKRLHDHYILMTKD